VVRAKGFLRAGYQEKLLPSNNRAAFECLLSRRRLEKGVQHLFEAHQDRRVFFDGAGAAPRSAILRSDLAQAAVNYRQPVNGVVR
jgi:hypothetical protein